MRIYADLLQGSPEWIEFRRHHIGASEAATVMGLNPWQTKQSLWEEKVLGWTKEISDAMERGTKMENQARHAYQLETGKLVSPLVAEDDTYSYISASFDGLSEDRKHCVEIKCGKSSHKLARAGEIPIYYQAQLQQQMYVSGLEEIDYWSFDGSEGILLTLVRDNEFIKELVEREKEFWHCVTNLTPPED
jgi:putative phage-type endonuclease